MPTDKGITQKTDSLYLIVTVFFSGLAVMLIEILAARIIAPYFGSSVFVWTAVISVTLLSLALGYFLGGRIADRRASLGLLYTAILLAGVYLFLSLFIRKATLSISAGLGLRAGALLSSSVLFALPLFLLGCITPLSVTLYTRSLEKVGSGVGILYFFSTAGSFCGTLLTGFVLLPRFSVSQILIACGHMLIILAALYFIILRRSIRHIALSALLLLNIPFINSERLLTRDISGTRWQELYKTDTYYGRLKVIEVNNANRYLFADGTNQGGLSIQDGSPQVPYAYVVDVLSQMGCPRMQRALVIGLGPGIVPNIFSRRGVGVDAVEIAPEVARIYQRFFAQFGNQKLIRVFVEDGRCFIKRARQGYDCVVLDVFLGDSSPWHLLTREAFSEIRARLKEDGILVINFVGLPREASEARIIRAIHRTLASVFPYAAVFNSRRTQESGAQNVFFLAALRQPPDYFSQTVTLPPVFKDSVEGALRDWQEATDPAAMYLSDDYNPVDFYTARTKEAWRRAIMDSREKDILLD